MGLVSAEHRIIIITQQRAEATSFQEFFIKAELATVLFQVVKNSLLAIPRKYAAAYCSNHFRKSGIGQPSYSYHFMFI